LEIFYSHEDLFPSALQLGLPVSFGSMAPELQPFAVWQIPAVPNSGYFQALSLRK